jgi:hypothetical protein
MRSARRHGLETWGGPRLSRAARRTWPTGTRACPDQRRWLPAPCGTACGNPPRGFPQAVSHRHVEPSGRTLVARLVLFLAGGRLRRTHRGSFGRIRRRPPSRSAGPPAQSESRRAGQIAIRVRGWRFVPSWSARRALAATTGNVFGLPVEAGSLAFPTSFEPVIGLARRGIFCRDSQALWPVPGSAPAGLEAAFEHPYPAVAVRCQDRPCLPSWAIPGPTSGTLAFFLSREGPVVGTTKKRQISDVTALDEEESDDRLMAEAV